jgi:antitoxin component of MazEF toxin-antitoxin module
VVSMELMELPTIAQSRAEMEALGEGRCHLTFDYEPHAAYGVRIGDVVIAQAEGGQQVALQVQEQHLIDEQIVSRGAERWAVVEQSSPELLAEKLSAAHSEGKELWGLNVQPLGTYVKGQITPFETPELAQQVAINPAVAEVHSSSSVAALPVVEKAAAIRLDNRIKWAEAIAPVVRLAHRQLSDRDKTDCVKTAHYLIGLDRKQGELLLCSKDDETILAKFSWPKGGVIAADGLSRVDFDRFTQKRRELEAAVEIRQQEQKGSLER